MNHEKQFDRWKRFALEVRKKMALIEAKKSKQRDNFLRIKQLDSDRKQKEEDERKKQMFRDELKQSKLKTTFVQHFDSILKDSSYFHSQTFPQWNSAQHSIKASTQQTTLFMSSYQYQYQFKRSDYQPELLRPKDIYDNSKDQITVFSKSKYKERWNLIEQGQVGDCSLISSIIAMLNMEEKKNQQIVTDKLYPKGPDNYGVYNLDGHYILRLFINGDYRMVEIDDIIPCQPKQPFERGDTRPRQIMGSKSKLNGEIWISLIEKGYLSLFNGYQSSSLSSAEVIYSFSRWIPDNSWDLKQIFHNDFEWKKLLRRIKQGNILMLINIPMNRFRQNFDQGLGLYSNHGYAVIDAVESGKQRLLRIRNPHGKEVYRGKFSLWDNQSWTAELKKLTNVTTVRSENECIQDGTFWMSVDEIEQYFDHGNISWNPDLLKYQDVIHFTWKEEHYRMGVPEQRNRYAPQFLMYRKSKDQKIWLLLNRHFQGKSSIQNNQEEDIYINIQFCKHDNPNEAPYFSRVINRHVGKFIEANYTSSKFHLLQIGLFDEDIHPTDPRERNLAEKQFELAQIQHFSKDYTGFFTVRIGLYKNLLRTKGDLRFSLFVYSDQEIVNPISRVKINHEDQAVVDTHWALSPMMEFNYGLQHHYVQIYNKGQTKTKMLLLWNSVGITSGKRSWQDDSGRSLIQSLTQAFEDQNTADAFFQIARFILGTQIDLILTPKNEKQKYGDKLEINCVFENGVEGGVHFSEVENGLKDPKANIGMGGLMKLNLYNDSWIQKGIAQRQYTLETEYKQGKNFVPVKKRALRIVPFTSQKYFGRRDPFTLESTGPEGYISQFIQRKGPWEYTSYEISWTDKLQSRIQTRQDEGLPMKLFYIIKAEKATELYIQFIMLHCSDSRYCPKAEFQVVKLVGPQLANEAAIATRLIGAADRKQWERDDKVLFTQDKSLSEEIIYSELFPQSGGYERDGWILTHSGSGRLDDSNAYYGLCVSALQFVDEPIIISAFAWSNAEIQLYRVK
ncbi:MAG: putative cysteine proteinase [Streblomastix strix]|uniref:Putative cysteine proteinase n=1 Tax=Streblomastix strix TaxID=222440 RepID=A0A5J4WUF7_9EUKA|nr:MAG: putative cysteine proteinase [Streblomastix strix]